MTLESSGNAHIDALRAIFEERTAHDVSELFLSPYVDRELFLESTYEQGPSLWVVNRSDVYDETLAMLLDHRAPGIGERAKEKINKRKATLNLLLPPDLEGSLEDVPNYMIEDLLGHPLVPFEAVLHFVDHSLEDFRGSAALSLTRRLLEHAPNWEADLDLKQKVQERFSKLLIEDASPFVRAYCARIPLLSAETIAEAARREVHPRVQAVLLQNPAATVELVKEILELATDPHLLEIGLADGRLPKEFRQAFPKERLLATSPVAWHINEYLLSR